MTLQPPIGRDDFRFDLTRWNRAGLTRLRYVDGNAAVWLEELRIGMLAQYLRGIDPNDRLPEKWRDLFTRPVSEWQLAEDPATYAEAVEPAGDHDFSGSTLALRGEEPELLKVEGFGEAR